MTENEIYLRSEAEKSLREAEYQRKRAERFEQENKALKSELAQWSRLSEGIELPDYPVTQFKPKDLERENTKLRELVADMWSYINAPVNQRNNLKERLAIYDDLADRLRDLGVEVDA